MVYYESAIVDEETERLQSMQLKIDLKIVLYRYVAKFNTIRRLRLTKNLLYIDILGSVVNLISNSITLH